MHGILKSNLHGDVLIGPGGPNKLGGAKMRNANYFAQQPIYINHNDFITIPNYIGNTLTTVKKFKSKDNKKNRTAAKNICVDLSQTFIPAFPKNYKVKYYL